MASVPAVGPTPERRRTPRLQHDDGVVPDAHVAPPRAVDDGARAAVRDVGADVDLGGRRDGGAVDGEREGVAADVAAGEAHLWP